MTLPSGLCSNLFFSRTSAGSTATGRYFARFCLIRPTCRAMCHRRRCPRFPAPACPKSTCAYSARFRRDIQFRRTYRRQIPSHSGRSFSLRYILEDHRNRNTARANRADPLLKIIRHRDIREFLQHEMHWDRQTAAPVLVFYVRYVHQKLEDLCYEGRCEKVEGRIIVRHPDKECRFSSHNDSISISSPVTRFLTLSMRSLPRRLRSDS